MTIGDDPMLSFLTVFSLFPHVDLEAREKHRAELMNDVEWKETCMTVIITSIIRSCGTV